MRVLVTGGTGFVGSHMTAALRAAGHNVRLLARDPAKAHRLLGARGLTADIVRGDVLDACAVRTAVAGCDAVVHAAAVVGISGTRAAEAVRGALIWRRLTMITLDSGYLLVDVRDVAAMVVAALHPGQGPQRHLAGHFYLSWRQLCDLVADVTGRPVLRLPMTGPMLRAAGRLGDAARKAVSFDFPLSREAMTVASQMVPMDDLGSAAQLGIAFRPPEQTLRDTYGWLHRTGRLAARWVPALTGGAA